MKWTLIFFLFLGQPIHAQLTNEEAFEELDSDLDADGDIFSDFSEDISEGQMQEDERFYRYGRFFAVNLGLGITSFFGNRGKAYEDNPPAYSLALSYWFDFQSAFIIGLQYSRHTMFIDTRVNGYKDLTLGAVETDFLRPFVGYRYYIDTSDLGTAWTYSNPYIVGRFEYWYQKNNFTEQPSVDDQSGGGIGVGLGFGLEFPIKLRESYIGVEVLFHQVNYFDRFVQDYRQLSPDEVEELKQRVRDNNGTEQQVREVSSTYGYDDLSGIGYSIIISYNITW